MKKVFINILKTLLMLCVFIWSCFLGVLMALAIFEEPELKWRIYFLLLMSILYVGLILVNITLYRRLTKYSKKRIGFVFGSGWEKGDFKFIHFRKTPLGFNFNIWRFLIYYDNWGKLDSEKNE